MDFTPAIKLLNSCNTVLILSHHNPDADAYGSSLGLALALRGVGKEVVVANQSGKVGRFSFIPGFAEVVDKIAVNNPELIVFCDCGELRRVGERFEQEIKTIKCSTINIDHHATNDLFGSVNLVDEHASSTCEIVYNLLRDAKIDIGKEVATALFSGISGDTGSFQYSSTTEAAFRVATELVAFGADAYFVACNLWASRSLAALKLEADVISNLKSHCGGRLVEGLITEEMYNKHGVDSSEADFIVGRLRDIKGVEVAVLFRKEDDIWRVNLRSKSTALDVSAVAAKFGGGGHKAAAAFRSKMELESFHDQVIRELMDLFEG
ncbi:MAG: bifunctional oligoribonuclease/PAP phosphatase NrnA [Candidatus Dadabacteria bacterium]|nr:MAG: bifunctional oligoribonuclease/PAP phosphatase NrnA [Candidatus Dadabacteria bacterium]